MNTPTTEEIEAVLDPLLGRLATAHPNQYVCLKRFRYSTGEINWQAGSGGAALDSEGSTPTEAVVNLIAARTKKRDAIRANLAKLEAELAALGPEKENQI